MLAFGFPVLRRCLGGFSAVLYTSARLDASRRFANARANLNKHGTTLSKVEMAVSAMLPVIHSFKLIIKAVNLRWASYAVTRP